jgi:hypothetical protein
MNSKFTIVISLIALFVSGVISKSADSIITEMMTIHTAQVSYMDEQSHKDKIVWNQGTNGVCVGLVNGNPSFNNLDAKQEFIGVVLKNSTTNELRFVVPQIPFQFDLVIFDEMGNPISRTWKGRNIGEVIPANKIFTHDELIHNEYDNQTRGREFLPPNYPELFTCINLLDYFKIMKPGKYRVEYEQRFQSIIIQSNQISLVGVVCPKAKIAIEVH